MNNPFIPCPFCGRNDIEVGDWNGAWYSECECGVSIGGFDSREALIKFWNTRDDGKVKCCGNCRHSRKLSKGFIQCANTNSVYVGWYAENPKYKCEYYEEDTNERM